MSNAGMAFDASPHATGRASRANEAPVALRLSFHDRLDVMETEWRLFERNADCTPFQTYDWLSRWHRHIGTGQGVQPAIVIGSFADGKTMFILPLGIDRSRGARRLCWLGQDLNDYNAPLIACDFSQHVSPDRFRAVWSELRARMQRDRLFHHDWIELAKMPQLIGSQMNPFFHLALATNPSGAHVAELGDDWTKFYSAKRSSATRRRDRVKRKRLADFGEISFVTSHDPSDAKDTLCILMDQKRRLLGHRGIPDMFARPGWREFFLDVAEQTTPLSAATFTRDRKLTVHIGRTQFGETCGATHLGVVFGGAYYHVLASYADGALAHYGPGALHLRELIANVIGLGLRRFDFTVGDEPYKLEWSDTHIKLGDYAAAATWRGVPPCVGSRLHRRVKRFIKQTPVVWRTALRLRAKLGPLLRWPRETSVDGPRERP